MDSTIKISQLTFLAFYINGAAGSGKYTDLTLDKCYSALETGEIFHLLESRLKNGFDSSLLNEDQKIELIDEWQGFANVIDHGRKLCIDDGGLNLVVAYILNSIQYREK
ncbi:hypothetical protein [Shewanella sp. HN-41]|uniref:hypothetical protein n=1 Tax=Shewanella sp. HN-41 TaxID=327275 RepID=UPI0002125830|nr:hypothetical protein [Shewanella sp. HN-41]EGM68736.1 hypothetical protein SOHN41_03075 [Shewanella sp. HN-41]